MWEIEKIVRRVRERRFSKSGEEIAPPTEGPK